MDSTILIRDWNREFQCDPPQSFIDALEAISEEELIEKIEKEAKIMLDFSGTNVWVDLNNEWGMRALKTIYSNEKIWR